MQNRLKKLIYAALLSAISIIIPLSFGFLKVVIGPFTATIASHVPLFIAMLICPTVAVAVGLGSAIGFFITSPLVVAARAAMHIFVGGIGGYLVKKKIPFKYVILLTAPIHGVLEALSVIPFGFTVYKVLVVVGLGTVLHHLVDGAISLILAKALTKSNILHFENEKEILK